MNNQIVVLDNQKIQNKIFSFRGIQVMLDSDLADLYGVETKVLNQAVKRNIGRFPKKFRFQLKKIEYEQLKSQIVTLEKNDEVLGLQNDTSKEKCGGRRNLPFVFNIKKLKGI